MREKLSIYLYCLSGGSDRHKMIEIFLRALLDKVSRASSRKDLTAYFYIFEVDFWEILIIGELLLGFCCEKLLYFLMGPRKTIAE